MLSRTALTNILIALFLSGAAKAGPEPFLWYDFDEAAPNTVAHDSSGNEYHGIIDTDLSEPNWDPADGFIDGCLVFNNDTAVIVPNDVLTEVNDAITIEIWLRDAFGHDGNNWIFDAGAGDYRMQAAIITEPHLQIFWRAGNDTNDVLIWDLNDVDPNLLSQYGMAPCFVKDETAGTMTIGWRGPWMRLTSSPGDCYFVTKTGVDKTLANVKNNTFKIGALTEHDHDLMGRMYHFAMYDYAFHFTCPPPTECPWFPHPHDGDVNVPHDANITWMPGDGAFWHDVYLGTDWNDVNDANSSLPVGAGAYKGRQSLGNELYDPCGLLELNTTYYWRIDEVNDGNVITCKGPIWRFTAADFVILDNFEQYDLGDNHIQYTWYDQYSQEWGEATGAWLELATEPNYVHSGNQAMSYSYDTDDPWADLAYAEAWLPLDEIGGFQDWTSHDVRLLTLFFYGDADNDVNETEQMYVGIMDTSGLYAEMRYGDHPGEHLSDVKVPQWQRWLIPLVWFTDGNSAAPNDVNFASIANVHIGFGNRRNPIAAGKGIVYFDDIRLYPPLCLPPPWLPDLNCDCIIDYEDLRIMALDWLKVGELPGQLVGNDEINFRDFAKLADYWLQDHRWPPE
ncbi:MAG TPA: hypothetical protein VMX13_14355 [Sedimentisphaerales bacterium]|nr:hypothetical protein [Sedimentisphaerales bacterium]